MTESDRKLGQARREAAQYRLRYGVSRALYLVTALAFFGLAVAIMYLALFYSDELAHTLGDCLGYKDGWIHRPCLQAVGGLWQRVTGGEPAGFFNL